MKRGLDRRRYERNVESKARYRVMATHRHSQVVVEKVTRPPPSRGVIRGWFFSRQTQAPRAIQDRFCAYCMRPLVEPTKGKQTPGRLQGPNWRTRDHVVPVAAGGPDDSTTNLVAACRACNLEKDSLSLLHFLIARKERRILAEVAMSLVDEATSDAAKSVAAEIVWRLFE